MAIRTVETWDSCYISVQHNSEIKTNREEECVCGYLTYFCILPTQIQTEPLDFLFLFTNVCVFVSTAVSLLLFLCTLKLNKATFHVDSSQCVINCRVGWRNWCYCLRGLVRARLRAKYEYRGFFWMTLLYFRGAAEHREHYENCFADVMDVMDTEKTLVFCCVARLSAIIPFLNLDVHLVWLSLQPSCCGVFIYHIQLFLFFFALPNEFPLNNYLCQIRNISNDCLGAIAAFWQSWTHWFL